jgi:hypothetical protein
MTTLGQELSALRREALAEVLGGPVLLDVRMTLDDLAEVLSAADVAAALLDRPDLWESTT